MIRAVEKVRERLDKAVAALEAGSVPYAVIGGNAVANWVARVDEGFVRNTRDVDILIRRADFDAAKHAMEAAGFIYVHTWGVDAFLDTAETKPSEGVHLLFAGEKVKPDDPVPTPELTESEPSKPFRVVSLEALVRMKLVSFRMKDRAHLIDLCQLAMIDTTWPDRFHPVLAERLREILADPDSRPRPFPEAREP
jgi:hypothetical protein